MRCIPQTRIGWSKFILFPFKVYVAVAFPLANMLPDVERRHGWNLSLEKVLPGYLACFLVLLIGGLAEPACHLKRESTVTLIFAAVSLLIYFGPWFSL